MRVRLHHPLAVEDRLGAVTATGSAVPVTSATSPGTIAPAPMQAACSSPVPMTTAQSVVSPSARPRPPGSACRPISAEGRIGASTAGSSPAASSSPGSQSPVRTSYSSVDDALA